MRANLTPNKQERYLKAHGSMGGGVIDSVGVTSGEFVGDHLTIL